VKKCNLRSNHVRELRRKQRGGGGGTRESKTERLVDREKERGKVQFLSNFRILMGEEGEFGTPWPATCLLAKKTNKRCVSEELGKTKSGECFHVVDWSADHAWKLPGRPGEGDWCRIRVEGGGYGENGLLYDKFRE